MAAITVRKYKSAAVTLKDCDCNLTIDLFKKSKAKPEV